jgi:hypothetical protein
LGRTLEGDIGTLTPTLSLLSLLLGCHEVNRLSLLHAPTVMSCFTTGPKQWAQLTMDYTSDTVSQIKLSSSQLHLSPIMPLPNIIDMNLEIKFPTHGLLGDSRR